MLFFCLFIRLKLLFSSLVKASMSIPTLNPEIPKKDHTVAKYVSKRGMELPRLPDGHFITQAYLDNKVTKAVLLLCYK